MTTPASSYSSGAAGAGNAIILDLSRLEALFDAPPADPFAFGDSGVLGESGVNFLCKRAQRRWPRRDTIRDLIIRLPAEEYRRACTAMAPELLDLQTGSALKRFCDIQMVENRRRRGLAVATAKQQLGIALVVAAVAVGLLALFMAGKVNERYPDLQGLFTILAVFATSLAIWDALESLFFDWVPYTVDNRAYRWIGELGVQVVPATPGALPSHSTDSSVIPKL
jgi:hypothetical protein